MRSWNPWFEQLAATGQAKAKPQERVKIEWIMSPAEIAAWHAKRADAQFNQRQA
jgi:hypothetical protein